MNGLYKVKCHGMGVYASSHEVYVIATSFDDAAEKALRRVRELKWDKIDYRTSTVVLIADEEGSNSELIVL